MDGGRRTGSDGAKLGTNKHNASSLLRVPAPFPPDSRACGSLDLHYGSSTRGLALLLGSDIRQASAQDVADTLSTKAILRMTANIVMSPSESISFALTVSHLRVCAPFSQRPERPRGCEDFSSR